MGNRHAEERPEVQQQVGTAPASQQPEPPKRRRKGLAIGLSVGALVVVVAVVLVGLSMTVWAKLDRQDYELAARFTETSTEFLALMVVDTESSALAARSGTSVEDEVAEVRDGATELNDHLDSLRGMRAVTDDPEIAALFAEFDREYTGHRDRLVALAEAAVPVGDYYQECRGNSSEPVAQMRLGMSSADLDRVLAEYDESQIACTQALEAIADGEHEWSRERAARVLELWAPLRDATEQLGQAAVANDDAAIEEATDLRTAAGDELGTAEAEFQNGFRALFGEIPTQESADALLAALEVKMQES